jgi:phosphate butyryltransferase
MKGLNHILDSRFAGLPPDRRPVVAVPMAQDPELLACVRRALADGVARFVLYGPPGELAAAVSGAGIDLRTVELRDGADAAGACAEAAGLAARGLAQVLMKGLVPTADFVHAILFAQPALVPSGGLLGHVAVFDLPACPRLLLISDAAINPAPSPEQRIELARNAAGVARVLGIGQPKVALVCPVEKPSAKVPSTVESAELVRRAAAGDFGLDFPIDGPFALDAAVSPEAATLKGIGGPVAGAADILVFPCLDAANAVYKSFTCLATPRSVGGIVAGGRVPVVLTSRADSETVKYDSLRLALAVGLPWTAAPG